MKHCVLALQDIDSEHNSESLAAAIMEVVENWGFASKLGYFVIDNAGNNNTMTRSLYLRQYDVVSLLVKPDFHRPSPPI
jgi:predicted RNA-binding protein